MGMNFNHCKKKDVAGSANFLFMDKNNHSKK
jgi:hypothetical protein